MTPRYSPGARVLALGLVPLLLITLTGCPVGSTVTTTDVVKQVLNQLPTGQLFNNLFGSEIAPLQGGGVIDAALAVQLNDVHSRINQAFTLIDTIGNAYLGSPTPDKYQSLLNAADAITANLDSVLVEVGQVKDLATRQRVILVAGLVDGVLHTVDQYLKSKATHPQLKAIPQVQRPSLKQVKAMLNQTVVDDQVSRDYGYRPFGTLPASAQASSRCVLDGGVLIQDNDRVHTYCLIQGKNGHIMWSSIPVSQ